MKTQADKRVAVILFNLGGPDNLDAVQPFLFNLFRDPAILRLPNPFRWFLAKLISKRRAPVAKDIYRQIGDRSPILEETEEQAKALELVLRDRGEVRVFTSMRYWRPFSGDIIGDVMAFQPDAVVLLPLYPQFSTTTTESSVLDWRKTAKKAGLDVPHHTICCYPDEDGLIAAHTARVKDALQTIKKDGKPRILFSAHGLPKKIVEAGDPYQWQVEQTSQAVIARLREEPGVGEFETAVCYQSRVGPLEWIGPSTEVEIIRAGKDGKSIIVSPIAFVSEHSETLVELDIEYRRLALKHGVKDYIRVPALKTHPHFIAGLAHLVRKALESGPVCSHKGPRICPGAHGGCLQGKPEGV